MATISNKQIVLEMLRNDGVYPGDPQVAAISSYRGPGGQPLFHLALLDEDEIEEARNSPYVFNLTPLWRKSNGLTLAGTLLLEQSVERKYD